MEHGDTFAHHVPHVFTVEVAYSCKVHKLTLSDGSTVVEE